MLATRTNRISQLDHEPTPTPLARRPRQDMAGPAMPLALPAMPPIGEPLPLAPRINEEMERASGESVDIDDKPGILPEAVRKDPDFRRVIDLAPEPDSASCKAGKNPYVHLSEAAAAIPHDEAIAALIDVGQRHGLSPRLVFWMVSFYEKKRFAASPKWINSWLWGIDCPDRERNRLSSEFEKAMVDAGISEDCLLATLRSALADRPGYIVRYAEGELPADLKHPAMASYDVGLLIRGVLQVGNDYSLLLLKPVSGKQIIHIGDHSAYLSQAAWRKRLHSELGHVMEKMEDATWCGVLRDLRPFIFKREDPREPVGAFASLGEWAASIKRGVDRDVAAADGCAFQEDGLLYVPATEVDRDKRLTASLRAAGFEAGVKVNFRLPNGQRGQRRYWRGMACRVEDAEDTVRTPKQLGVLSSKQL